MKINYLPPPPSTHKKKHHHQLLYAQSPTENNCAKNPSHVSAKQKLRLLLVRIVRIPFRLFPKISFFIVRCLTYNPIKLYHYLNSAKSVDNTLKNRLKMVYGWIFLGIRYWEFLGMRMQKDSFREI